MIGSNTYFIKSDNGGEATFNANIEPDGDLLISFDNGMYRLYMNADDIDGFAAILKNIAQGTE